MIRSAALPHAPVAPGRLRACAVAALGLAVLAGGLSPAAAVNTDLGRQVVSDDPANFTPQIMDGSVKSIAQIGSTIVAVGDFTRVRPKGTTTDLTRNGIVAFDATTGDLDLAFDTDLLGGYANSIDTDGTYLYIGGSFGSVDGVVNRRLARLTAAGTLVPGLTTPDNVVNEVVVRGNRLFVGGKFTSFQGVARPSLGVLDTGTGQLVGNAVGFAGTYNGGSTAITRMDLNAAGTKLVAVGNFTTVDAQPRAQVAVLDTPAGGTLTVSGWATTRYTKTSNSRCSNNFETLMNDVDVSPDGSYFVATTTGAFGGGSAQNAMCDTNARWELAPTTGSLQPTWVNYTGGDTSFAVAITGSVVYVGGHFRWANNPYQGDQAGPGAVPREGIVALDSVNGLPLRWNPGRARGVGAEALLATPAGLWVGHDTNTIGGETRRRIAFMPLAGGTTIATTAPALLPNPVYLTERSTAASGRLLRRTLSATGAPTAAATVADSSFDWRTVRGAALVNGTLYYGASDNRVYARPFDPATGAVGAARQVDLHNDPDNGAAIPWTISGMTGLSYDDVRHRFYYTVSGSSTLYYRQFTPESETVGALQLTTSSSVGFSTAAGMFLSGGRLFYGSSSDGALRSVAFDAATGVVSGSATTVSTDGTWRFGGMVVGTGTTTANQPPTASFTASCTAQRLCSFDASASSDADGQVTGWSWAFGDGSTATGRQVTRQYGADGTYSVTLTVTDDKGATGQRTQPVTVTGAPVGGDIALRGTASSQGNLLSTFVTVPANVQAGDLLVLSFTQNAARAVAGPTGVTGWTLRGTQTGAADELRMSTWTKVAQTGDAGAQVTVAVDARVKLALNLLAYSGTNASQPVVSYQGATETVNRAAHTTPGAPTAPAGAWVVSLWADKSSAATGTWTEPAETTQRLEVWNDGAGRVSVLVADSGGSVSGAQPGLTATATSASAKAVAVTLVIAD